MKKILLFFTIVISTQLAQGQCVDNGNQWAKSWTSCQVSPNPNTRYDDSHWVLYEFTQTHYIDSSHIWNANRIGESGTGIKDILVDYSLDGTTWIHVGNFSIPQAPETDDYPGAIGPNFGSTEISKILITVLSTHDGGSCASIAEIIFAVDGTQCHGIIDECGKCNGPGAPTWYVDADGDGLGSDNQSMSSCDQPFGFVGNNDDICDSGQLGWDEIYPIFENSCKGCHIENVSGGLNLGSYATFVQGGLNCGTSLLTGTTLVGVITIDNYDGCTLPISFPAMNSRTANPISPEDLLKIQRWIDGEAPQFCLDFCPDYEEINNTFVDGTIAYRQTNMEISSSSLIESNTLITFDAGQQMQLDSGFTILQGGQFIARLDGCR